MRSPAPKLPATGKHIDDVKIELSANQSSPGLASPRDFDVLENGGLGGETLPFDGSCGDTASEYHKLLRVGKATNKKTFVEPDEFGRTLAE